MRPKRLIALDIETTGLNWRSDQIHGIGIATQAGGRYYAMDELPEKLVEYLRDPEAAIVGHNVRFDLKFLRAAGLEINCQVHDTVLLAQLMNENRPLGLKHLTAELRGLDSLSEKNELDRVISKLKLRNLGELCAYDLGEGDGIYHDIIGSYCVEDCENTLWLFNQLWAQHEDLEARMKQAGYPSSPLSYYLEEAMPAEAVLQRVEERGIRVDVPGFLEYREVLAEEIAQYMFELHKEFDDDIWEFEEMLFEAAKAERKSERGKRNVKRASEKHKTICNLNSSDHIVYMLCHRLGVDRGKLGTTDKGAVKTSESALALLLEDSQTPDRARQFIRTLLGIRKAAKLLSTYVGELDGKKGFLPKVQDGRIHARYVQAASKKDDGGTVTGRLSSREPNLQNLPRSAEIKRFLVPDPGHKFLYFDYSQVELRIAADLFKDALLTSAYNSGEDVHSQTAAILPGGNDRQLGKTVNFLMIYDGGPRRLAAELGWDPDNEQHRQQCKEIIDNFFQQHREIKDGHTEMKQMMQRRGFVVAANGRIRRLPDARFGQKWSKEWRHAIKQGLNFVIQSVGATVTKRALVELAAAGYDIVTTVHDSAVVQVKDDEHILEHVDRVRSIAENCYKLSVPLKVDIKLLNSLEESDTYEPTTAARTADRNSERYQDDATRIAECSRAGA